MKNANACLQHDLQPREWDSAVTRERPEDSSRAQLRTDDTGSKGYEENESETKGTACGLGYLAKQLC